MPAVGICAPLGTFVLILSRLVNPVNGIVVFKLLWDKYRFVESLKGNTLSVLFENERIHLYI